MNKLNRDDLMSLEEYAEQRGHFRSQIMAHKKNRSVALGPHIRLLFEDTKTIQYQVQEMLRIERIFERAGIEEELEAYNPLIPDGRNLKATMMIEFDDPHERKLQLAQLIGVEKTVYLHVDGFDKVYPIANEDLERETDEKTSSVHFLRFEFSAEMITAWKHGANVLAGIEHENCFIPGIELEANVRDCLQQDFDAAIMKH